MSNEEPLPSPPVSEVAIVGMACRFPGARNVDEFWRNLVDGVESISFFSDEELRAAGVPNSLVDSPNYIKAKGMLADVELFDANFFGFNPREAQILDPQHRLFLECAWEAVEDAGYESESYGGRIGVYAGASMNTYLLNLYSNRELVDSISPLQLLTASDKDFLATRVSYKLNLSGPSITVQTACSTSLVAVHLACQSLLNGECDMALAGGVSIRVPQKSGYLYQEGGVVSPDGRCRAFDAKANGTVGGDGVGIVLLKRLEDALTDGDCIRAIIKGSAVNNDGSLKAGFTAPSTSAQAVVIAEAQAMARVEADSISYIEAHGTGTTLGDPIEVVALTQAFRVSTQEKGYCAIGSVKTNIGHLDAAAGVAGLIKTVKALEERKIPPSLHFRQPNPKADFANSPFYVNDTLTDWTGRGLPRRAGVSSFGMGGTNVHLVLEEAPRTGSPRETGDYQLLILSARTPLALEAATTNLAEHLRRRPEINLADVAYTLQAGRKAFEHRRAIVCRYVQDAQTALTLDSGRLLTTLHDSVDRHVVFMFSGQGSQYVNMGLELYRSNPKFQEGIDRCSQVLEPYMGLNLTGLLYPEEEDKEEAARLLGQTFVTQPALFVIEYALAQLWMQWGVQPRAMIGHSIGEYVAACLAGVFSLEDALAIVAARGRLMNELPPGAMLAVLMPEDEARALLNDDLSMAAVNGSSDCVVSGTTPAIDDLEKRLIENGSRFRRLHTSHAFHSEMMEPVLSRFAGEFNRIRLNDPKLRYVSNLTGRWVTAEEATDPSYWVRHMRQPVLFRDGLGEVFNGFDGVLLEVGPGDALSTLARRHPKAGSARMILSSLPHPQASQSDAALLLTTLGKLWLSGVRINWSSFYAGERRERVPLPTYPFERQRYWIEAQNGTFETNVTRETDQTRLTTFSHPRPGLATAYVAPRNEVEQALAGVWEELLGLEQVGVHDDFFSLGGHSLLASQLVSQLRDSFEVDLPLYKLFETPTISGLAGVIEEMLLDRIEGLTDEDARSLLNAQS